MVSSHFGQDCDCAVDDAECPTQTLHAVHCSWKQLSDPSLYISFSRNFKISLHGILLWLSDENEKKTSSLFIGPQI
jgi:hypothetical protein